MFDISLDTKDVDRRLDEMAAKIRHFKSVDLGQEMSAWQTEDMHRHRPFTMRFRKEGKVQTTVRQHSLYEMLKSEGVILESKVRSRYARAVKKHLKHPVKRLRLRYREHRHWSQRPILRAALEQTLGERMVRLLEEKLSWG
jgi:hypothetical protein